jgi:indole-3-glycerol phosphate synthase
MTILEDILSHKRKEVAEQRELYPTKLLERSIYFDTPCVSLKKYLMRNDRVGIIAEIKRKSPSKGVLNPHISVEQLSIGYMQAGASALSVLTDQKFFGGKAEDLTTARKFNYCPILRKDFVVDEYQIVEAKSIGADVVLLIAAALPPSQIASLAKVAKQLGMEVLLEIHTRDELRACIEAEADLIGVNNRDLATFTVDVSRSLELASEIPGSAVKVSESGIADAATISKLKTAGYKGFLIGEAFMRTSRPEAACRRLIDDASKIASVA